MAQRKNSRNLKPNLFISVSILIFLIPLGFYFFLWVPERKDQLSQRYLRLVAMMSDQFEKRGLSIQTVNDPPKKENQETRHNGEKKEKKFIYCAQENKLKWNQSDNEIKFPNVETQEFFDFVYKLIWKQSDDTIKFPAVEIREFFDFVYLSDEFDDILLIRQDGEIIYRKSGETEKGIDTSLQIEKIESLQKFKESESEDKFPEIVYPNFKEDALAQIIELEIAKSRYLLFLQPIPLQFVNTSNNNDITNSIENKSYDGDKFPWYMGGLLAKKEFQRRSQKISPNVLWIFSLLLFLFLICLPVFKLIMMSPKDRIKLWDVIFVGVSLLIGIPLILYLIAFGAIDLINKSVLDQELKDLSNEIHESFVTEIDDARYQLETMLPEEISQKIQRSIFEKSGIKYPFLDMIFLMDEKGMQTYKGVPQEKTEGLKLLDVSDREYFIRAKNKEYWFTKNDKPIMLQTVYSKTSGKYELNLSMPCKNNSKIAGVSFRPLSVLNPVLPYGFGFAMIDRSGRVIFHSDPKLNFYENFFSECDKSNALKSSIWGRSQNKYHTYYQGKKRTLYARPIQNIPWTLIVFRDNDIDATHNLDTIIHTSFLFWFYVLGLITVLSVSLLGCWIQKKILPSPAQLCHRKFRWLWPDARLHEEYNRIAVFNTILFLLLMIYSYLKPSLWLFLIPILIACFHYFLIQRSLCNFVRSTSSNSDSQGGRSFPKLRNYSALILTCVFLIVLIIFLVYKTAYDFPILAFLSVFLLCLISFLTSERYKPDETREPKNYKRSFSLALYSIILLFIAYPALSSLRMVYTEARWQCLKIKQVNLARARVEWDHWYNQDYEAHPGLDKNIIYKDAVKYGVYSKEIKLENRKDEEKIYKSFLPEGLCAAICDLVPSQAEYTEKLFHLQLESGSYFTWKHPKGEKSKLKLIYTDMPDVIYDESGKTKQLIVISELPQPDWGNKSNLLIFVISIITILLFLLYVLFPFVSFINRVIFPQRKTHSTSEEIIIDAKNILAPGKYIIMGNPRLLASWLKNFALHENCQSFNCAGLARDIKFAKLKKWIILENFDYKHMESSANLKKIELLEELTARGTDNIVILSQYEPLTYFNFSDKNTASRNESKEESQKAERVEQRFQLSMGSFKKRYMVEVEKKEQESGDSIYLTPILNRVHDELNKEKLPQKISESEIEDLIFEYAQPVYDSIWYASSNEEKYFMICLALDGMVNLKNDDIFQFLLKRKLITLAPLNFFHKTFRKYIRNLSETGKILGWQSMRIDSMWTKLKRPAMILLFGLILFFAITQPNLIRTWLLIIPALSGTIPALLRIIGQMSKNAQGSAS